MSYREKFLFVSSEFDRLMHFCAIADIRLSGSTIREFISLRSKIEKDNNIVLVSHYIDLYNAIHAEAMSFSPEEALKHLISKIEELYPNEAKHMQKYINVYEFYKGDSNMLVKGDIQSGKTMIMVLTSLCYLVCNRDVIIVVRNKLDDKKQFIERFKQVVEDLKEHYYTHPNFTLFDSGSLPSHACAFVEIYHKNNLNKLYSQIRGRNLIDAVIYIDEADLRGNYTEQIFKSVGKNLFVSATVQDIVTAKWNIRAEHITRLTTPSSYKGISDLNMFTRDLTNPEELFYTFCDIAVDKDYQVREDHPKIALVSIDKTLVAIDRVINWFLEDEFPIDDKEVKYKFPKEIKNRFIIKYTGKGIELYPSLKNERPNTSSMKDTLRWMSQNGGKERFPNIFIVAGCMADRGINFADYVSRWHLTHQVLLKSKSSTCANIQQSCRILGIHSDDIPLKLYTTNETKEKLRKSFHLSENILEQLEETKTPENYVDRICKEEVAINKDDIPDKFLARGKVHKLFQVYREENEEDLVSIERKFRKWSQERSTKISQFVRLLNPDKMYSKSELLELLTRVDLKEPLASMMNSRSRDYGAIFKKIGDRYIMYDTVKEAYRRWFQ